MSRPRAKGVRMAFRLRPSRRRLSSGSLATRFFGQAFWAVRRNSGVRDPFRVTPGFIGGNTSQIVFGAVREESSKTTPAGLRVLADPFGGVAGVAKNFFADNAFRRLVQV